jgi:hypothetical protein
MRISQIKSSVIKEGVLDDLRNKLASAASTAKSGLAAVKAGAATYAQQQAMSSPEYQSLNPLEKAAIIKFKGNSEQIVKLIQKAQGLGIQMKYGGGNAMWDPAKQKASVTFDFSGFGLSEAEIKNALAGSTFVVEQKDPKAQALQVIAELKAFTDQMATKGGYAGKYRVKGETMEMEFDMGADLPHVVSGYQKLTGKDVSHNAAKAEHRQHMSGDKIAGAIEAGTIKVEDLSDQEADKVIEHYKKKNYIHSKTVISDIARKKAMIAGIAVVATGKGTSKHWVDLMQITGVRVPEMLKAFKVDENGLREILKAMGQPAPKGANANALLGMIVNASKNLKVDTSSAKARAGLNGKALFELMKMGKLKQDQLIEDDVNKIAAYLKITASTFQEKLAHINTVLMKRTGALGNAKPEELLELLKQGKITPNDITSMKGGIDKAIAVVVAAKQTPTTADKASLETQLASIATKPKERKKMNGTDLAQGVKDGSIKENELHIDELKSIFHNKKSAKVADGWNDNDLVASLKELIDNTALIAGNLTDKQLQLIVKYIYKRRSYSKRAELLKQVDMLTNPATP